MVQAARATFLLDWTPPKGALILKEHYNINDEQWTKLTSSGRVTVSDLFKSVDLFNARHAPVSKVSLCYYVDNRGGNFIESPRSKQDRIAQAVWNSMSFQDKLEVAEYANWDMELKKLGARK